MGSVSPQNSKNKVVLTYNPYPLPPFFYSLSFVKRKRGNVDFVRKPSHTRASSIPVCIHASLLHAGKSPVAVWHRSQSLKVALSKNLSDSLDTFGKSYAEYCEKQMPTGGKMIATCWHFDDNPVSRFTSSWKKYILFGCFQGQVILAHNSFYDCLIIMTIFSKEFNSPNDTFVKAFIINPLA